jgi:hypothetical protein
MDIASGYSLFFSCRESNPLGNRSLDCLDCFLTAFVEGPFLDALAGEESRLRADLQMFRNRRLAHAQLESGARRPVLNQVSVDLGREMPLSSSEIGGRTYCFADCFGIVDFVLVRFSLGFTNGGAISGIVWPSFPSRAQECAAPQASRPTKARWWVGKNGTICSPRRLRCSLPAAHRHAAGSYGNVNSHNGDLHERLSSRWRGR